jgi:hypothetical protein
MPVFSFHLVDAASSSDLGSQEYDAAVHAAEVADLLTRRLAVEAPALLGGDWAIVVKDERGEIYRSPIGPERIR